MRAAKPQPGGPPVRGSALDVWFTVLGVVVPLLCGGNVLLALEPPAALALFDLVVSAALLLLVLVAIARFFQLFAKHWVVRLPDAEIEPAKATGATGFEPMPGRPMKAFVVIPAADVADDDAIAGWVERGLAHAASLPAKK